MALRVCIEPGCPTVTRRTRCLDHERARDKARGRRQARGYDSSHETERAKWQALIDRRGSWPCMSLRCKTPNRYIVPGEAWDLGHTEDRTGWTGPEHPECNRATSQRVS